MFLFRTLFWLSVVVLLLPADKAGEAKPEATVGRPAVSTVDALYAARDTMHDMTRFCDRNPMVCDTGNKAFGLFAEKAKSGARMLYDWAAQNAAGEAIELPKEVDAGYRKMSAADANIITGSTGSTKASSGGSQNTLRPQDLVPVWGGPAVRGRRA